VDGDDGEGDAEGSAYEGEDGDFGEGRLQEMGGGGSEGGAYGGFAVSADETGELGVGEVDAGDEEDAEDGGHEEPESGGGAAYDDLLERLDVGGERSPGGAVQLVGGNLAGDVVGDNVEVFRGLVDGDTGLQVAEGDVVAVVAVRSEVSGGIDRQRGDDLVVGELASEGGYCEFVRFGKVEVLREDSDDLEWCSGDLNGSSDDVGVAVEEGLPEMVTDDGDVLVAFDGLLGQEVAPRAGWTPRMSSRLGRAVILPTRRG
jgi:hypothetical protein